MSPTADQLWRSQQGTSGSANCQLVASEAADTCSITAKAIVSAALSVTEAQDAAAMSAKAIVSASLSATDGQDTAAGTAKAIVSASLSVSEAQDTASFSASVIVDLNAALAATEASDSASFSVDSGFVEEVHAWSEYKHPREQFFQRHAVLRASEAQDRAQMSAAFDYTDDELVLALMSAAWDREQVY